MQLSKNLHIIPDNRSFFCLLFFSKKSRGECYSCVTYAPDGLISARFYNNIGLQEMQTAPLVLLPGVMLQLCYKMRFAIEIIPQIIYYYNARIAT